MAAFLLALAVLSGVALPTGSPAIAASRGVEGFRGAGLATADATFAWARPASCAKASRPQISLLGGAPAGDARIDAALPIACEFGGPGLAARRDRDDEDRHAAASGLFAQRIPTGPPSHWSRAD